jgi:SAM-dependent methyltransferase
MDDFDVGTASSVLDIGCGPGPLAIGILSVMECDYTGVDVQPASIRWCKRHIERRHPSFKFHHLDVANERYNTAGTQFSDEFRFDLPDRRFDVIVLWSVFTHMQEREMRIYLRECARLLRKGGRVYITVFVENAVPNVTVNPPGYLIGPLHVVRYERDCLNEVLHACGFQIDEFKHHSHGMLSALYLSPRIGA